MQANHLSTYTPALKWRMGAYQALNHLSDDIKEGTFPLLELTRDKQDLESEKVPKTLREQLEPFGKRLSLKWQDRPCMIDSYLDDKQAIEGSGQHHLSYAFETARQHKTHAIPVVSPHRAADYKKAVREIAQADGRGAAIRVITHARVLPSVAEIDATLSDIGLTTQDCHIILDARSVGDLSVEMLVAHWIKVLANLNRRNLWKSTTILASAFPASLPSLAYRPNGTIRRTEWLAYQSLVRRLRKDGKAIPRYGDYTVTHPEMSELNMRVIDPTAKIKYTLDDDFYVGVGTQVRANGRGQLKPMCQALIRAQPRLFMGPRYCFGDKYIQDCADGGSTGGSSSFNTVAYNHHITHAVRQLAKLNEASTSA